MVWKLSSAAGLESAARAALSAAFPLALNASRAPRPTPEARLPAFTVTVTPEQSEPAGMGSGERLIDGTLRVEVFAKAAAPDRPELADLATDVVGVILGDPGLAIELGAIDAGTVTIETEAEAAAFARIEVAFGIQWLEAPAVSAGVRARFGLA
ncbi:hypothetical protein [Tropicimonas sp. IMCC34043]|uniref:hypothetical protein n=1 Tax=Tropicimonas sp. IMCC34043 TaxID=2248760 RepID=UPI000E26CDA8|nr:hypothetical protein [Tropicimonas sp. IMCC34043]